MIGDLKTIMINPICLKKEWDTMCVEGVYFTTVHINGLTQAADLIFSEDWSTTKKIMDNKGWSLHTTPNKKHTWALKFRSSSEPTEDDMLTIIDTMCLDLAKAAIEHMSVGTRRQLLAYMKEVY